MAKYTESHPITNGVVVTHTFESELSNIVPCDQWIKDNKSAEELAAWNASHDNGHTVATLSLYKEWLTSQKVVHTIEYNDERPTEVSHYTTYTIPTLTNA